jgi:glycosyltransferase involved in cell wall biosynthesis
MAGGGSERQLLNLIRGLDLTRFHPSLYLLYAEGALLAEVPAQVEVHAYWNHHRTPWFNFPGRIHQQQVRDFRSHALRVGADLVYDRLFHMTMIAGRALRGTRIGRISTIVSPPSQDLVRSEKRALWLKRRLLSRCYRQADQLIAVSAATADDAARFYGIDRERFLVIPSPIDCDRIDQLSKQPLLQTGFEPNAKHIVSIGRLSTEKGHNLLLDACAQVRQRLPTPLQLHLVGDGPNRAELESQARRLGLEKLVCFHGHLTNPYPILVHADLCVLPSWYEGLPNVMLEAIYTKIPFLATRASESIADLSQKCGAGRVVAVGDVQALGAALVDRFQNSSSWTASLDRGRQYVRDHHHVAAWLEQMQELFQSTIHRRSARS